MNNNQDKQEYLALELTKLLFTDKVKYQKEDVYKSYTYFLVELTQLLDTINTASALKNEIERLQKENLQLKANNQDVLKPFKKQLYATVQAGRGDMEPYVYNALISMCDENER